MDKESQLSNAIYEVIKKVTRGSIVLDATVIAVDETAFTCDVRDVTDEHNPTDYFDVPLRVLISQQASIIEIPKIDTKCLICFRDGNINRPQILSIHEALKILVICDNIVFNNGTLGGMVKLNDLVNDLNSIKQDINNLKTAFSSWVVVPNDGGQALKTAAASWYGQSLTPTQPADLANDKIKQ
jgi:hypothetical protein